MSISPFGEVPPRMKTFSTFSMPVMIWRMASVVRSVSSSVAPGGSSTLMLTRETSSGGRNEPGTWARKYMATTSEAMAANKVEYLQRKVLLISQV